ncbi:hypothetical protein GCM10022422_13230 [Flavobacterium ginsengisoli]|uniref:Uncharacterized protein n=1 Tax=Flavobacterium ginsengisoli TaxID=871694 RepID=A0ABP7F8A5_9FLAO
MDLNKSSIIVCDECRSEFYVDSSVMKNLCPECAHYIYGYENCKHEFNNDRCSKCYWNGNSSDYINRLKSTDKS